VLGFALDAVLRIKSIKSINIFVIEIANNMEGLVILSPPALGKLGRHPLGEKLPVTN
jgi:hypothetical protein